MDCEQALTLISADVDRETRPEEHAQLEAHLGDCAGCRVTAEAFRLNDTDLRQTFAPRREAAAATGERVVAQLESPVIAGSRPPFSTSARRFAFALTAAAALLGLSFLVQGLWNKPQQKTNTTSLTGSTANLEQLTPRPRPATTPPITLALGESLQTKAGERRRVALPDGSILYVNQNSAVQFDAERHLTLSRGEVFVEVSPREQSDSKATFVVQTAKHEVSALGTKFAVRAENAGNGVLVAQGKVQVSGHEGVVAAGQQMPLDGKQPVPAPRLSAALDWTKELMVESETPLVPGSQYDGGALIAVDSSGQEAKLALRKYHIDVHIEDGFARTTIDQTYFNHANFRLEGTFYFPLPPDASLSRLAMYVDGTLMEGGMAERDYARQVYENIVRSQRDPALLEWVDGSTFKMRVFPLEARQEKRIILSYTQRLSSLYGRTSYRFPAGHNLDVVHEWKFHAAVKDGASMTWSSDTHALKETKEGAHLFLDHAAEDVKVDRDVALELVEAPSPDGAPRSGPLEAPPYPADAGISGVSARFSQAEHEGAKYLMLRYRPALGVKAERQRRDWVFLFESSGDRDPLLARTQIDVVRALLTNAEHDDTFVILAAGTRVQRFRDAPVPATSSNVREALAFLDQVHLVGALDLGHALTEAVPYLLPAKNPYLIHVGGGLPGMGEHREDVLSKHIPAGTRYVGVGVGKHWSRSFMKMTAERTGGYFTQINPDEPAAWRGFELFATLNTPRLLDVKVVDNSEKAVFLSYNASVAQGEELCAIARIDAAMPKSVTITGTLDGLAFTQEVNVENVAEHADYLPRTWAKLEIDRLLAELGDNPDQNKNRIVELSKAMYVMTPYTSLLVLENDEMYKRFNVDRGRKDHWAMYPCPPKIPVVYEPLPGMTADRFAPKQEKPQEGDVLQTILVRMPARFLRWPDEQGGQYGPVVTAVMVYTGAFALPQGQELAEQASLGRAGATWRFGDWAETDGDSKVLMGDGSIRSLARPNLQNLVTFFDTGTRSDILDRESPFKQDGFRSGAKRGLSELHYRTVFVGGRKELVPYTVTKSVVPLGNTKARQNLIREQDQRIETFNLDLGAILGDSRSKGLIDNYEGNSVGFFPPAQALVVKGTSRFRSRIQSPFTGVDPNRRMSELVSQSHGIRMLAFAPDSHKLLAGGREDAVRLWEQDEGKLAYLASRSRVHGPQQYARPMFTGDERLFSDLVAYAPGMNTSAADIQAVLESEAVPSLSNLPGRIDPAARTLIDKARTGGWQTLKVGDVAFTFDGSGRYAYETVSSLGLHEQVACDGKTLLHLYPELGIGARRTVSRFHRAEITGLVPWVLPPVDDLAHGADVLSVDDHTLAISPRDADKAKDAEGNPVPYLRELLVFAEDGRLAERRLVVMPENKTLLRETYDADAIKVFDRDNKEVASRKLALAAVHAPDLQPNTSDLVVLPLPMRSRDYVLRSLGFDPNRPINPLWLLCAGKLEPDAAIQLFASEIASHNGPGARAIYNFAFKTAGNRKLGFYTLLSSCGENVSNDPDLLAGRARDPLANYLALHGNWIYRALQRQNSLDLGSDVAAEDTFLGRLARMHDRVLCLSGDIGKRSWSWKWAEQERGYEFVRRNKSNVLGLSLLTFLQQRSLYDNAENQRKLAESWKLLADQPGLRYIARFEEARALANGDRRADARKKFRELYEQTLKDGALPVLDGTFRWALQSDGKDADEWTALLRETASRFVAEKHRPAAVALAWQCWQLGDQPLAQNLLTLALADVKDDEERLITTLAAVEFLFQTSQFAQADTLVQGLLENADFATSPWLWRLAERIASQRGMADRAIVCLEKALDLEYRELPEVINLQEVRNDYGRLLNHYQSVARSAATLKTEPPADLLAKTIRITDRWRALDRDGGAAASAAEILRLLGAKEMAWEYQTTPFASQAKQVGPWLNLAQVLNREGDFALADRAYATAFETQPDNPHILWDRAQNLRQGGSMEAANKLLLQIADGDWKPEHRWMKDQARWQSGR